VTLLERRWIATNPANRARSMATARGWRRHGPPRTVLRPPGRPEPRQKDAAGRAWAGDRSCRWTKPRGW